MTPCGCPKIMSVGVLEGSKIILLDYKWLGWDGCSKTLRRLTVTWLRLVLGVQWGEGGRGGVLT